MPAMKRLVIASLLASSLAAPPAAALTIDPFLVFRDVARRPVKTALPREGALADEDYDPCDFGPLPKVLDLLEVVERSLCQDPQVRQAWAQAKYQAAVLAFYLDAAQEAQRVLRHRGVLLVKCQDAVSAGRQHLTHVDIINALRERGMYAKDLFILGRANAPAVSRILRQVHARKAHSYLIVFTKEAAA